MAIDMRKRGPIGLELVRRGIITEDDINRAIEFQRKNPKKKIGDILDILRLCDPNVLIDALGEILDEKPILLDIGNVSLNVTEYMSIDIIKQNKAIPFEIIGNRIKVCFADTSNRRAIETVRLLLLNKGLVMEKYITFENRIDIIIESLEGQATDNIESSGNIIELVDTIIKTAMEKRASDIHIEPLEEEVRVRYRIDGELITVAHLEKTRQTQIIGRLKAISNMHQEKQEAQDRKNYIIWRL